MGKIRNLYEYNGEKKSLKEWADEYGIKYQTLYHRIYRYDISLEDALKMELKIRPVKKFVVEGVERSMSKHVEHYKKTNPLLSYENVTKRVRYGWTIEEALELKEKVHGSVKSRTKYDYASKFMKYVKIYGKTHQESKYKEAKRLYRRLMECTDLTEHDIYAYNKLNSMLDTWKKTLKTKR